MSLADYPRIGILQFNSAAAIPGGVGGGQVVLINANGIASNGPAFTTRLYPYLSSNGPPDPKRSTVTAVRPGLPRR